ncbi:hypothetical protein CEN41_03340 [Fischerella thermalis CCMEE 5330]|uniref:Uncharacterized protein n=1 Tax=Fischerella thermalis CCMEE 5330 TaxID=2019670 RepID=A0A2N6MLE6_9CYAN|nr:hypothetical protein [Fischerella thermalis]PMB47576.1 hypothetical protein CEN41_03340 [Fischerella thermalis CCMEE 5330]
MNKSQAVALFLSLSLATGVTACTNQPKKPGGGEEGGSLAPTSPSAANWHQPAPVQTLDATLPVASRGERGEGGEGGERGEGGEGGERSALPSSQIV